MSEIQIGLAAFGVTLFVVFLIAGYAVIRGSQELPSHEDWEEK